MSVARLALRGLRFHWRPYLGVLLGAALATAILVGAVAVGDTVRHSLHETALARLGGTRLALAAGSRFFREGLAEDLSEELRSPVAPAVVVTGSASTDGGEARAGRVQVVGVDSRFWALSPSRRSVPIPPDAVAVNERLARRLGLRPGSDLLIRVEKPSLLSREAPLSTLEDATVAFRLEVARVVGDADFGRFGLTAEQIPPLTAFVALPTLQRRLQVAGRANTLLVGGLHATPRAAAQALWRRWQLADASLELRELPQPRQIELRSDRVFLDPAVAEAADKVAGAQRVLTYFVNELRVGDRSTPYSTVAALEADPVTPDLRDDEALINQWLAEDLGAKPGDLLTLRYYVVGPMRRLTERSGRFRIRGIVPLSGPAADPSLMPDFPGVADSENCRDWRPGIPIDLDRIRDKDEEYWDSYRGTPKAFITLRAGQCLWNNRFGNLTSVRYPLGKLPRPVIEGCIRQYLSPPSLGLTFQPVREQALAAASQSMDFGQLFLGFSSFLIIAALLLTGLLFGLGVEQRAEESGVLMAAGWRPRQVRGLYLLEGALVAALAAAIGAAVGIAYTRGVVYGLNTVWSSAVAGSLLRYHAAPATLAWGALAGFGTALLAIVWVSRRQAAAPARELLAGAHATDAPLSSRIRRRHLALPVLALAAGLALVGAALLGGRERAAGLFFGAGACLLVGGIGAARVLLARAGSLAEAGPVTLRSLAVRNSARRMGRSLAAVALLACGAFLVIAVGANRHDPAAHAGERASGTGGFALYGETSLPVYSDLNSQETRESLGLDGEELRGLRFLPLRLREGDEASCLNLNRAQQPRLLGVNPDALRRLRAFRFNRLGDPAAADDPWSLLERPTSDGSIPVVGDTNTVVWSLGRSLGDTLDAVNDRGGRVRLRVVGILANCILQGGLMMAESAFVRHFPGEGGYRVFLIDGPRTGGEVPRAAQTDLMRSMEGFGLELTPAVERLAAFATVENTYLSIFAALGGLGLALGTLGLAAIVLRNVLERRGELAVMRAVGFSRQSLRWLVFGEHSLLLALGLAVGVLAAVVAVAPSLSSPGAEVPLAALALILVVVLALGLLSTLGAASFALRGPLLSALRDE